MTFKDLDLLALRAFQWTFCKYCAMCVVFPYFKEAQ